MYATNPADVTPLAMATCSTRLYTCAVLRLARVTYLVTNAVVVVLALQVRYGTRVLELAKGKNSIEVGSGTELLSVLETVKKCVELGELDTQIEAASAAVRERFAH